MSGGSFNYLYCNDAENIFQNMDNLEHMADKLTYYGYASDAEKKTRELIAFIEDSRVKIQDQMDALSNVWYAVEWHCSGDCSEDAVKHALEKYRQI